MAQDAPSSFEMQAASLVAEMTLEEKASLMSGTAFWHLQDIERLRLPKVVVSDGPHGLRRQLEGSDHLGLGQSVKATCFPAGVCIASSWDVSLCREMAERLGAEAKAAGVSVVLGPAINIKRSPLCGRNFEYYSEDPYLAGELACSYVNGMQSKGVGTSIKHFAANNQETARMRVDTCVDERTLREIYLPAFERAVKGAQPWTVMSAYNRLNGTYASENHWLLTKVLREDWGFEGLVVSDWGGTNSRIAGIAAGGDLEMPGSGGVNDRRVQLAVESGKLDVAALDAAATRVVSLILAGERHTARDYVKGSSANNSLLLDNHAFARRAAIQCAVLLKNERGVLPLRRQSSTATPGTATATLAVIGLMAEQPRFQGAGSSKINEWAVDSPLSSIRALVEAGADGAGAGFGEVRYAPGYNAAVDDDETLIEEAVAVATAAQAAVVFLGLPAAYEAEGIDRTHMRMPEQMNRLMAAVGAANPCTVVVLLGGAPVEVPNAAAVPSILYMGLAGQAMGGATADLLFGLSSPSGKLAETWPMRLEDTPSHANFGSNPRQVVYREALNVGYRYFSTHRVPVRWPFGHGMTYSQFAYSNLKLSASSIAMPGSELVVSCDVRNVGDVTASEVVQLYIRDTESSVHRPDRELKGFRKVRLEPGQMTTVSMTLSARAFSFYNTAGAGGWHVEPGEFQVLIGASCEDIKLTTSVDVTGGSGGVISGVGLNQKYVILDDEELKQLGLVVPPPDPALPVTANTTFHELSGTGWFAWLFVQSLVIGAKQSAKAGAAEGLGDGDAAVSVVVGGLLGSSLRSLQLMTSNMFNDTIIEILLHLFNGKPFSAIGRLFGIGKTSRIGGPAVDDSELEC